MGAREITIPRRHVRRTEPPLLWEVSSARLARIGFFYGLVIAEWVMGLEFKDGPSEARQLFLPSLRGGERRGFGGRAPISLVR